MLTLNLSFKSSPFFQPSLRVASYLPLPWFLFTSFRLTSVVLIPSFAVFWFSITITLSSIDLALILIFILALRVLQDWRPWASVWWRQVSSDPLCPIYFIIHCPAYYEQPKDLLAFYLPCPWFTFWVTMVSYMLALYFNQWTWWDTMMILWFYSGYDDILVAFRGLGLFPEYLSVRTCSLRDHPG